MQYCQVCITVEYHNCGNDWCSVYVHAHKNVYDKNLVSNLYHQLTGDFQNLGKIVRLRLGGLRKFWRYSVRNHKRTKFILQEAAKAFSLAACGVYSTHGNDLMLRCWQEPTATPEIEVGAHEFENGSEMNWK